MIAIVVAFVRWVVHRHTGPAVTARQIRRAQRRNKADLRAVLGRRS